MHNVVLVNGGDMVDVNQQENRSWKSWVGVWRTIIRSSLNKTMYPYCHYLRNLNLGELEQILDDLDSKPGVEKKFKTYSTTSLTLDSTYLSAYIFSDCSSKVKEQTLWSRPNCRFLARKDSNSTHLQRRTG